MRYGISTIEGRRTTVVRGVAARPSWGVKRAGCAVSGVPGMTSPELRTSAARIRESAAADVTGVLVLGACAGWALVTAAGRDARPEGLLLAVLAVGAGYATGRIAGSVLPAGAAASAGAAGAFLALAGPHAASGGVLFAAPAWRPEATAALLTLSVGALCCAAWAAEARPVRWALRLAAAGVAACALLVGTPLGFAAAVGVLVCSLAAGPVRRRTGFLAAFALAAAAVSGVTFAVAHDGLPRPASAALHDQLAPDRVALWRDAADITRSSPLSGSGPGTFGDVSAAAQAAGADNGTPPGVGTVPHTSPGATQPAGTAPGAEQGPGPNASQGLLPAPLPAPSEGKPHSAALQVAAEQGLPGLALLAAAFGWLLLALWASPRQTPLVVTAGASLAALAALAATDDALSCTEVTAGAGLLAGLACARRLD